MDEGDEVELRQLQYFVAVAEHGGFGRAAEGLNIVQSAVSQQIRRLERELGVTLFDRSTRHTRLSAAGERLLPEARAALAAVRQIGLVAEEVRGGRDGVLRLGTVQAPGDRLYRALARLADSAPRLRVRLRRASPAERLAGVERGELDAALVRAATLPDHPGIRLFPVWHDPLYVAVPAGHPLAAQPELRLEQLGDLPMRLAAREHNPPFHDLVTAACRTAGIDPPHRAPFTGLQETLAELGGDAEPSWTVFYEITGLPRLPHVAVRPLVGPTVTTSLAVPTGTAVPTGAPTAAVRLLLRALEN
ncbi:LysR family transcriptional regulator [Kitasatospora sp. NPDC056181]|uniref:LysR family transcriptional regulator n=1 Tax=Kitasatospora sp. NPDC056181 TaxID=3345737 RepID=UPI0035E2C124